MDPPFGKVPEQGPDWFLVSTDAYGGRTPDLGSILEVWGYIRGVGIGNKSGGSPGRAHGRGGGQGGGGAPPPVGGPGLPTRVGGAPPTSRTARRPP